MTSALVGLAGVILGLGVGFGYRFWAARRSELAEAVIASAVIGEELRALTRAESGRPSTDEAQLLEAWRDHRRWFVLHMSPEDFERIADAISQLSAGPQEKSELDHLAGRMDMLNRLFWEEYEAFILTPLGHYLTGNTVSKRIHQILQPR